jgi:hypothetical protein
MGNPFIKPGMPRIIVLPEGWQKPTERKPFGMDSKWPDPNEDNYSRIWPGVNKIAPIFQS